ncbi:hypothetical protein [Streptomyces sp. NPDC047869]|uniref:hypothetical protein n=1 Tax=Streptomyces sp. NPDC047869 TaxID=3154709 RepID=UPI003452A61D
MQPLVRKIPGGTITIVPGEAPQKAPSLPEAPSAPRSGSGEKMGKAMGVFGVIGDLAMFWDMSQDVQRGCGGWLPDCVTPQ